MENYESNRNAEYVVVGLLRQLTTLQVNVPNLLQKSIKEDMNESEDVFIIKLAEQMESMLNRNDMSINQKRSLRITRVKSFGILLYRQTIL